MGGKLSCTRRRGCDIRRSASLSSRSRRYGSFRMPQPAEPRSPLQRSATMPRRSLRYDGRPLPLDELAKELNRYGLLPPKLIFGIDFTASNEWTGKYSFQGRNLHDISESTLNPYEEAVATVGRILSSKNEVNSIQLYGFGDASTKDKDVFGFHTQGTHIHGFDEALACYREIVPQVTLAGPTAFTPMIDMAMNNVCQSGGHYHVLIIITDGQNTTIEGNELSAEEQETVDAICRARRYPLFIFMLGVGDQSSYNNISKYIDCLPHGDCNNFEFVNFTKIMANKGTQVCKELDLARFMMEKIYEHYLEIIELDIIGDSSWPKHPTRVPILLPRGIPMTHKGLPPTQQPLLQDHECPICFNSPKDMALGCGHQICYGCATLLHTCPICRRHIHTKIRLF